jgi:diguanylate cyclase (GGDEF)-like protein
MNRSRPFHWSSLLDTVVFLALLTVVNLVWFRHVPAFRSYPLHPYLLPIALVGLFYGFREGVASVLVANAFYSVQLSLAGYPAMAIFQRPDVVNVLSFLVAGVFFGEAGELYQRALFNHRERAGKLDAQLAVATDERNRLEVANRELEEWIRFGDVQLTEIHAASDDLFSFDEARILEAAAPLALKIVGAEQGALYLYDRAKGRFWRRAQAGTGSVENPPTVSQDAVPFLQMRQKAAVLSVRELDAFTPTVRFLAAAPIVVQGSLHGVLLIESMPLIRLTSYTLANLGFLSDLINRCLDNAARQKPPAEATVEAWESFRERVEQEVHSANRYNGDLSLVYMDIRDFDAVRADLGADVSESLVKQVVGVVERNKRKSDVLSYQGNGRLALLMPQTAPEKTAAFIERTREQIGTIPVPSDKSGRFEVAFTLGTQALAESGLKRNAPPVS